MKKLTHTALNRLAQTIILILLLLLGSYQIFAQSLLFTYQGKLNDNNSPANGTYDFQFKLFDALTNGNQIATTNSLNNVTVNNGIFTVTLNFGNAAFTGPGRWLEISTRLANAGTFTTLSPRQLITSTPYALRSLSAAAADGLSAACNNCITTNQIETLNSTKIVGWPLNLSGNSSNALISTYNSQGTGVQGSSASGAGVNGNSDGVDGIGVYGNATSQTGLNYGVAGSAASSFGIGVYGNAYNTAGGGVGVKGESAANGGRGISGVATHTTGMNYGVLGESVSTIGTGVYGFATASTGANYGVYGLSLSNQGIGVYGKGARGIFGESVNGIGISGVGGSYGLYGTSNTSGVGVYGIAAPGGTGVYGQLNGVGAAIIALNTATSGFADGLRVTSSSIDAVGILAKNTAANGTAGRFDGNVAVYGALYKSAGSFKIDHPLDPANKYLSHSFVESPDMMNIYNGVIVLNDKGEAEVGLPDWFEALNQHFRYQLTCIGGFAPVYIAEKVKNNRFRIAGGQPGLEVSWQVTGIRHDAYAEKHRIPVEELKPEKERGFYLHPADFGQPIEKGILWGQRPEQMKREREERERLLRGQAAPADTMRLVPKP